MPFLHCPATALINTLSWLHSPGSSCPPIPAPSCLSRPMEQTRGAPHDPQWTPHSRLVVWSRPHTQPQRLSLTVFSTTLLFCHFICLVSWAVSQCPPFFFSRIPFSLSPLLFWPLSLLSFPIKTLENDLPEKLQYLKICINPLLLRK